MSSKNQQSNIGTLPATIRVERDLRHRLMSGHWNVGDVLPSRRKLAQEYDVDQTTVQRAVVRIAGEGMLRSDMRRGTFVSSLTPVASKARILPAAEPSRRASSQKLHGTVCIVARDWSVFRYPEERAGVDAGWGGEIVSAVEHALSQIGLRSKFINLSLPHSNVRPVGEAIDILAQQGADAFVFVETDIDQTWPALVARHLEKLPALFVGERITAQSVSNVFYDGQDGAQHAAQHLIEQGCRRLAFLGIRDVDWVPPRIDGVRDALRMSGRSTEDLDIFYIDMDIMDGSSPVRLNEVASGACQKIVDDALKCDGIVAANDRVGVAFVQAAKERGYRAGADFAIIGFDDSSDARACGLTSLRPPLVAMGREASALIVRSLRGEHSPQRSCLQMDLVLRSSSTLNRLEERGAR